MTKTVYVTDWTEGHGLTEAGFPDPEWRTFCEVYQREGPNPDWDPSDKDHHNEYHWICKIVYGTTWGHLHFGKGNTVHQAMREAFTSAVKAGMPIRWAPDDLDL